MMMYNSTLSHGFRSRWRDTLGLSHGRVVPPDPLFHLSVRAYMMLNPQYKPNAQYVPGTEKYVP
jgi:hypothetical protein